MNKEEDQQVVIAFSDDNNVHWNGDKVEEKIKKIIDIYCRLKTIVGNM